MKITQHFHLSLHPLRRARQAWLGLFILLCVLGATLPAAGSPATPEPTPPVGQASGPVETGPDAPVPPVTRPGIYVVAETGNMDPNYYHLTGSLRTFNWAELHTGPNQFNWGALDQYLATIASYGKAAAIGISTYNGRCCGGINGTPAWVWQSNANAVVITSSCEISPSGGCPDGLWRVPRYWFRSYLNPYATFIAALGNRYKNDARVEWISMGFGTYGENKAGGNQGEIDALIGAGLTKSLWMSTTKEIIDDYVTGFRTGSSLQKGVFAQIAPYTFTEAERWELANYAVPRWPGA